MKISLALSLFGAVILSACAANPPAGATATAANDAKPEQVCVMDTPVGTRFSQWVCHDKDTRGAYNATRAMQNPMGPPSASMGGH